MSGRMRYHRPAILAVAVIAAAGLTMLPLPAMARQARPATRATLPGHAHSPGRSADRSLPLPKTPPQPRNLATIGGRPGAGNPTTAQAAAGAPRAPPRGAPPR